MTAHKAQGKTLSHAVINLENCSGTEAPYVMISRVTSLEGLLILKGFSRSKITCRQSQECRDEARRHQYLALQTIACTGTSTEASAAEADIRLMFNSKRGADGPDTEDESKNREDDYVRLERKEKANAVLIRTQLAVSVGPLRPVRRVPRKGTSASGTTAGVSHFLFRLIHG
jgi:hypothetical protein